MIYAILAISAIVDMAIVYGLCMAMGFHSTPYLIKVLAVGVLVCYGISHVIFFRKRG